MSLCKSRVFVFAFFLTFFSYNCFASNNNYGFTRWLQGFETKALSAGVSRATLDETLPHITFLEKVIEYDRRQPDKTMSFNKYITNVIPQKKITMARSKYSENSKLLKKIGAKYKVQPRFIVALWALESNFGTNMGNFDVIDSLASLAYEGRRRDFFTDELINALKIIDKGPITKEELKGSWAGAMGQSQFMPSSFLKMAVAYGHDGQPDIWNKKSDVFASIANYLAQNGWNNQSTWGREVKLPKNFSKAMIGKSIEKNISEWNKLGVRLKTGGKLATSKGKMLASLIQPDEGGKSRTFLVYSNYKTILKWNRSLYFATSVGLLSDKIAE